MGLRVIGLSVLVNVRVIFYKREHFEAKHTNYRVITEGKIARLKAISQSKGMVPESR